MKDLVTMIGNSKIVFSTAKGEIIASEVIGQYIEVIQVLRFSVHSWRN
jgi:hypothetical protein